MTGPVDRRQFLGLVAAGAAGVAGCSVVDRDGPETVTPVDVPDAQGVTRTTVGGPVPGPGDWMRSVDGPLGVRRPSLVRLETGPRVLAVAPTRYRTIGGFVVAVRLVGTASDESPARLQALLYNRTGQTSRAQLDRLAPFGAVIPRAAYEPPVGESPTDERGASLVLVPTQAHDFVDASVPVTRGPDGYWHAADTSVGASVPETVTLDAEGYVTGEFFVCAGPEAQGLRRGRYRFTTSATGTADDGPPTVVVWNPAKPGPRRPSAFDGAPAPSIRPGGPVEWFHRTDRTSARYLLPETERVSLPALQFFHLVNRGSIWRSGRLNLFKRVDDLASGASSSAGDGASGGREWYHVGPRPGVHLRRGFGGIQPVQPDGVADFPVWLTQDRPDRPVGRAIGYLGGGEYAFVVVPPATELPWHGARVTVEAPELTPRPQPDVRVERDGSTVVVTDSRVTGPADASAVAVAHRVGRVEGRRLIPEQVMGQYGFGRALWNTLPLFEPGVDTVEYYAEGTLQTPPLAPVIDELLVFEGTTIRLSVEDGAAFVSPSK